MLNWKNYILPTIHTSLDVGHILASELLEKINEHDGSELYHCVFDLEPRDTFKEYHGSMKPAMGLVYVDFDGNEKAQQQTKEFIKLIPVDDIQVYFSGNRGFHVYIPQEYVGIKDPSNDLDKKLKQWAINLKEKFSTVDFSIYQAAHKLRVPGSMHPKTNLYKCYITHDQLNNLSFEQIKEIAKQKTLAPAIPIRKRFPLDKLMEFFNKQTILEQENSDKEYSFFKSYDNKPCIKKLETKKADEGNRHSIALILASEYFHTGMFQDEAEKKLVAWYHRQGIGDREKDAIRIINSLYSGSAQYSYGCKSSLKSTFCTSSCPIYWKLKEENRPFAVDGPNDHKEKTSISEIPERNRLNLISFKELLKLPAPKHSWCVDKLLLAGGTSCLAGSPKIGKSTITRQLACNVSKEVLFFGRQTKKVPVWYIAVEENLEETREHFKKLGVTEDDDIFIHASYTPERLPDQIHEIAKTSPPGLIILDTFTKTTLVDDINDSVKVNRAVEPFQRIAKEFNMHILFVHHLVKGGHSFEDIAGSHAIRGAFDCNMVLKEVKNKKRVFSSEKRYGEAFDEHVLLFDDKTQSPSLGKLYYEVKIDDLLKEIIEYLVEIDNEPLTLPEIKEETNESKRDIRRALKIGLKNGDILKKGSGTKATYTLSRDVKSGDTF